MRRALAVVAVAVALVPACTKERDVATAPSASPTVTSLLSPEQQRLSQLAGRAAAIPFDAAYSLTTTLTKKPSSVRIIVLPPGRLRVDVRSGGQTASSFQIAMGTVACKSDKTCVLVARPGEKVPEGFDPGVQRLFSSAADELGRNPGAFDVSALPDRPKKGRLPASECFHVTRRSSSPAPKADPSGFETGDYCFTARGVPTLMKVNYGTLTLKTLGGKPTPSLFVPPKKPIALPELSPTPTPTKKK
jgi:hypothetical protein